MKTLQVADLASRLGFTEPEFIRALSNIPWPRLDYEELTGDARDHAILEILRKTSTGNFRVAGSNDNSPWQRGWGEVLAQVKFGSHDAASLMPKYFANYPIVRLDRRFLKMARKEALYEIDLLVRRAILHRYFSDAPVEKVVELGCGTGTTQNILAEINARADLVASDWAPASMELLSLLSQRWNREIRPVLCNMLTLEGWSALGIDARTAVITVHALEQLGSAAGPLQEALVRARPKFCVHLEPILELYDENDLVDYSSAQYHRARNYLSGWLSGLQERAATGEIEILEQRRLFLGDQFHEGYSLVVWKSR